MKTQYKSSAEHRSSDHGENMGPWNGENNSINKNVNNMIYVSLIFNCKIENMQTIFWMRK